DRVEMETIGKGADAEEKPVLYFVGKTKGLIMNRTNADEIGAAFGDETDHWNGKSIELYVARVRGPNGSCDGLRVRALPEKAIAAPQPSNGSADDDLDDTIPF